MPTPPEPPLSVPPGPAPTRREALAWAAALLGALALPGGTGCRRRGEKLRIATNPWIGYEPLYLARSLGHLDPERVHLVELGNATDVSRAFRGRLVDLATLTLDETLQLLAKGDALRVILVLDQSNGADALLGGPGIRELAALKGRRIGVEAGALGAYMLIRALEQGGLALQDVTPVPLTLDAHEAAFRSGRVDAVVTFEPVRSRLVADGAKVLFDSSQIPGEVMDVLVAHAHVVGERHAELEALQEAWFRALDHLGKHPEEAAKRIAPRVGLAPKAVRAALGGLAFPGPEENRRLLGGGLMDSAERLQRIMLQAKLLPRPGNLADLLARP